MNSFIWSRSAVWVLAGDQQNVLLIANCLVQGQASEECKQGDQGLGIAVQFLNQVHSDHPQWGMHRVSLQQI
jgi:hypothetical protein